MMVFGLPFVTFFFFMVFPLAAFAITIVYAIVGRYEGKKIEEEYGEENWYNTF